MSLIFSTQFGLNEQTSLNKTSIDVWRQKRSSVAFKKKNGRALVHRGKRDRECAQVAQFITFCSDPSCKKQTGGVLQYVHKAGLMFQ